MYLHNDFVFEQLTRTLSIWIKYEGILAENPLVFQALHFGNPPAEPVAIGPPSVRARTGRRGIVIGTSFVHDGNLFVVVASDGSRVTASCDVVREEINATYDEVWQIIMSNIG
jgi:hypothetical protein